MILAHYIPETQTVVTIKGRVIGEASMRARYTDRQGRQCRHVIVIGAHGKYRGTLHVDTHLVVISRVRD